MTRPAASRSIAGRGSTLYLLAGLAAVMLIALMWVLARVTFREQPQVRVGLVVAPENEPLALARQRGAIDTRRVCVVEFCSFEDMGNAFLDGNVHAGVFPLDDALRLCRPPWNARIEHYVGVSRMPILLLARPGVSGLAGLRGRVVGLESGRREMNALRAMLGREGLGLADVTLDRVDSDSGEEGLQRGIEDAVMCYPPASGQIVRAGGHVIARWQPERPGEMYVVLASSRAHRLASEQIAHFDRAWLLGVERARHPDRDALALMAHREGAQPDEVAAMLDSVRFLSPDEDRRLLSPAGRAELEPFLDAIRLRWRALGIKDPVPMPPVETAP